jgi:hypothetical protein
VAQPRQRARARRRPVQRAYARHGGQQRSYAGARAPHGALLGRSSYEALQKRPVAARRCSLRRPGERLSLSAFAELSPVAVTALDHALAARSHKLPAPIAVNPVPPAEASLHVIVLYPGGHRTGALLCSQQLGWAEALEQNLFPLAGAAVGTG